MTPIIQVEGLGKKYRLHHQPRERYTTLRDTLVRKVKGVFRRSHSASSTGSDEDFWALKDVNFEVGQGEVVGIIGRNGAGKSTLLKVLSRITEPSVGRITLRGRVASLLEVGTGFHPELTGRENIFLNGAILGMTRAEIRAKFDEIVAFAEVERFLDTPVKHYSSGMYVRLAFAVAAHLEPEILVVDEVLAVGDAEFQKKCLGKMKDVATGGRTVLFVSHQLDTIRTLCSRAVLLNSGSISMIGDVGEVLSKYIASHKVQAAYSNNSENDAEVHLRSARIANSANHPDAVVCTLEVVASKERRVSLDVRLQDKLGSMVGFGSLGTIRHLDALQLSAGVNQIELVLRTNQLAVGSYMISLDITEPFVRYFGRFENILSFEVEGNQGISSDRSVLQSWGYGSYVLDVFKAN